MSFIETKDFSWRSARFLLNFFIRLNRSIENHFKQSKCTLKSGSKLYPSSSIDNLRNDKNSIEIGENSTILGQLLIYRHGGNISVGQNCFIGEDVRIWSAGQITIGDRVLISHGVNIHDNDSHSMSASNRHFQMIEMLSTGHPAILPDVPPRPIVIDDDVWIGFNAAILKGVTIGKGAVVGACAVVTRNVPPYTIVAGNPAKAIGRSKE